VSEVLGAAYSPAWRGLVESFETRLEGCTGAVARGGDGFYSYNLVAVALRSLRLRLGEAACLNQAGLGFVSEAAAYLARIAAANWARRGLDVEARLGAGSPVRSLVVAAKRQRAGVSESIAHDFIADVHQLLLRVPACFPYHHKHFYLFDSPDLPSPEYLYLFGVTLLQSPHAAGNWPQTGRPGGIEEDFEASKNLWIDDLHQDAGIPRDDEALRRLSYWLVFPPYGYEKNAGQEYNLVTLFSQVEERQLVPRNAAVAYLRRLLTGQAGFLRNLAARALMVYGEAPKAPHETHGYLQALAADDYGVAAPILDRFERLLGRAAEDPEKRRRELAASGPRAASRDLPDLVDSAVLEAAAGGRNEALRRLQDAVRRWPWHQQAVDACLGLVTQDLVEPDSRLTTPTSLGPLAVRYYERRAPEYEAIYARPERQPDLCRLASDLSALVAGRHVLELACGTGYWTRRMAAVAASVAATDASERLARSAARSCDPAAAVSWSVMDAFAPRFDEDVDCVVAGFFFSHVPLPRIGALLSGLATAAAPETLLVFFDNRYVEGSSTPVATTDAAGNGYQLRRLADGSEHRILKNFPTAVELRTALAAVGNEIRVREYEYYWLASCKLGSNG
jgi:SAM-dependent methyltransferase